MERQGIDKAYKQEAHPDAGTRSNPGKDSSNPCDAMGKPGSLARETVKNATERPDSKSKELIGQQLGSNGMQSNGYDPEIASYITPAPRRGFGNSR